MSTSSAGDSQLLRLPLDDILAQKAHIQLLSPVRTVWILACTENGAETVDAETPVNLSIQCKEDAWRFAERNGLLESVIKYTELAREYFRTVGSTYCRLVQDPETSDRYLSMVVNVTGSFEDIIESEDRFRSELVRGFSASVLYLLRLSFCAT